MTYDNFHIERCRKTIEQKLGWGDSSHWQSQDFDTLSEKILEETRVSISSSTLKRIWGKVKYNSSPTPATLNALALFTGYGSWRAFCSGASQPGAGSDAGHPEKTRTKNVRLYVGLACIALVISFISFRVLNGRTKTLNFNQLVFTSRPVTAGVPNTVVFHYDANLSNADSVFIQQNWNPALRVKVDKNLHEYTTTYYQPGYYQAKLFLNNTLAKEHDLFIESEGWLGMIEKDHAIPIYFTKNDILKSGAIGVSEAQVKAKGIDLQKEMPWAAFYDVGKAKIMPGDDFELEAEVKNTFGSGDGICRKTLIGILFQKGLIVIPLSIKGCTGELNLRIGNRLLKGRTNNLSGFGADFNDFVQVKCRVKNQAITISVNGKTAYAGDFRQNMGNLVGTIIKFKGAGTIKRCVFRHLSDSVTAGAG